MEKEYWLFTLLTKRVGYVNCWYSHFPTKNELQKDCSNFGDKDGVFAIINIAKLTEEQYATFYSKPHEKPICNDFENSNNEVTNFMYYMFNKWCIEEAKKVFGNNLGEHIFNKWVHHREDTKLGDLYWYSELDNECRRKIVERANELYNK